MGDPDSNYPRKPRENGAHATHGVKTARSLKKSAGKPAATGSGASAVQPRKGWKLGRTSISTLRRELQDCVIVHELLHERANHGKPWKSLMAARRTKQHLRSMLLGLIGLVYVDRQCFLETSAERFALMPSCAAIAICLRLPATARVRQRRSWRSGGRNNAA